MPEFQQVPNNLRDREAVRRGREPKHPVSRALLNNGTMFVVGAKSLGSYYTLAKNHDMQAKTKKTVLNDKEGFLIWFIPRDS